MGMMSTRRTADVPSREYDGEKDATGMMWMRRAADVPSREYDGE
jgi:hypothetical protein